jgi:hypothetical protein
MFNHQDQISPDVMIFYAVFERFNPQGFKNQQVPGVPSFVDSPGFETSGGNSGRGHR